MGRPQATQFSFLAHEILTAIVAFKAALRRFYAARAEGTFRAIWTSKAVGKRYCPAGRNPLPQSAAGVAQKRNLPWTTRT
jgi:hypothetical protein